MSHYLRAWGGLNPDGAGPQGTHVPTRDHMSRRATGGLLLGGAPRSWRAARFDDPSRRGDHGAEDPGDEASPPAPPEHPHP